MDDASDARHGLEDERMLRTHATRRVLRRSVPTSAGRQESLSTIKDKKQQAIRTPRWHGVRGRHGGRRER